LARGGDTRAAAAANGKRVGRPPKPKPEITVSKGVAARILFDLKQEEYWKKRILRTDLTDEQFNDLKIGEKRLAAEGLEYLTDRVEGKPAVAVMDKPEDKVNDVSFGNLPRLVQPAATGKPN
jgi:hypothetical protein